MAEVTGSSPVEPTENTGVSEQETEAAPVLTPKLTPTAPRVRDVVAHKLDGGRAKLARARLHIEDVRREEMAFIDSNPYGFRVQYDPMGGLNTARAVVRADVTPLMSPIIGDALHNL